MMEKFVGRAVEENKKPKINLETFTLTNYTNFYIQNQMHLSTCLTYILSLSIIFFISCIIL